MRKVEKIAMSCTKLPLVHKSPFAIASDLPLCQSGRSMYGDDEEGIKIPHKVAISCSLIRLNLVFSLGSCLSCPFACWTSCSLLWSKCD